MLFPLAALASTAVLAVDLPEVDIFGLVEVEAYKAEDFDGTDTTDITLATVELGFDANVAEHVNAYLLFLYEEDETDPPELDEGIITLSFVTDAYVAAGKMYTPFGRFDTNMISDPLTLEVAETNETAIQLGFDNDRLSASLYVANGDSNKAGESDDEDLVFGVSAAYVKDEVFEVGIGYVSNIADSDAMQDIDGGGPGDAGEVDDFVAGLDIYATVNLGRFQVMAEHVRALDDFVPGDFNGAVVEDSEPTASQIELAYEFENGLVVAVSYQETDEALFMELPQTYTGMSLRYPIMKNTSVAFEYSRLDDYSGSDGGTGEDADQMVVQLATFF